jgi:hypothetical protein
MATVAGAQDLAEILNPDAASMELRGFWRRGLPGLDKLTESRGFWRRALTEGPKRKKKPHGQGSIGLHRVKSAFYSFFGFAPVKRSLCVLMRISH